MAAILEQYRISDFLEWHREKKLVLNPEFQRRIPPGITRMESWVIDFRIVAEAAIQ